MDAGNSWLFCNGEETLSLKSSALSGIKWTTLSTVAQTGIQLAQLAILARLLEPSDFGLMAIMMIVIGFSQAFMDMGISNAIIHRQNITHDQLSSLYWLNLSSGLVLFAVVAAISPLVGLFYREPRITEPMLLLSFVFVIVALGNQYRILCQKELQFNKMAKIDITASVSSFIVAVVLAVYGYGVYALVVARLTESSMSSILFLAVGLKEHHRPKLIYRHADLKGFYQFGLYQMAERSINYISANFDKLIIGKMLGIQAVGFYNMAWQLIIFPLAKINPILNRVTFPVYAKVQNDSVALNRYYSFSVKTLSLVTVPLLAFLSFFAADVVLFVFGEGWETSATLVTVLAFVGILKALGNPGGAIILAKGRADVGFWWNMIWAVLVVGVIYGVLTLVPQVEVVPYVLLALSLTIGMIWHWIVARIASIAYGPIVIHFAKIIIISFIITGVSFVLITSLNLERVLSRLAVGGTLCAAIYLPYLFFFEREILKHLQREK
ncbi:MAG: MOP flippase family protein [Desulfobulbaceae bacterium]|nr:MOP flippase family protein [Desulfobulbaceae bacterium]